MGIVTGLTAERMLEIEAASIVDGDVVVNDLILTRHDGTTIDAGNVRGPAGANGATGPAGPTTLASGDIITWGADVNLYRSAADILKTDDAFVAAGGYSIGVPLTSIPAFQSQQVAGQTVLRNKLLAADGNDVFHLLGNGQMEWGPGGAGSVDTTLYRSAASTLRSSALFEAEGNVTSRKAGSTQTTIGNVGPASQAGILFGSGLDTNLYRSAADTLRTDDSFGVGPTTGLGNSTGLYLASTGVLEITRAAFVPAIRIGATGDAQPRIRIDTDGTITWGSGAAVWDTDLFRSAADTLKTEDNFIVDLALTVNGASSLTGQLKVDQGNAGVTKGLAFGSALDTNLYRAAADSLKTDDAFTIAGASLTISGTGSRIFGQFSANPIANRTLIQGTSSTFTSLGLIPPTGASVAAFSAFNTPADLANTAYCDYGINVVAGYVALDSSKVGTGTTLPIGFAINSTRQVSIATDGKMLFGTANDTNLYRSAADTLMTDDAFVSALGFSMGSAITNPAYQSQQVAAQVVLRNKLLTADANASFQILGDGKLQWGPGGGAAVDTVLYRFASNALKTDNSLYVAGSILASINVVAFNGLAANVYIGDMGSSVAGISMGSANDTKLYRSAAGVLTTEGKLVVGSTDSPGSRGLMIQFQQAKTNTTPIIGYTIKSNEAFASNPQTFDLVYKGAAALANREHTFQTGESGVSDGGIIGFQTGAAGDLKFGNTAGKIGFFGTAPIVKPAVGAAAVDAATTQTLANNLRTALINLGLVTT